MWQRSHTTYSVQSLVLTDWLFLLVAFWFGSYLCEFSFARYQIKPLYSYFLLLALAFVHYLWSASRHDRAPGKRFGVAGLYCWLAAYLVYGVLEFLRSPQDEVTTQALIDLCEAIVLAAAFTAFLRKPQLLKWFALLLCIVAILGSCLDLVDFVTPLFSKTPGRAAGLYVNPNIAGIAIALAMIGGIEAVPRWLRLPYLLFCGLGILLTFSRESWIAWALGVVLLAFVELRSSGRRLLSVVLIAVTAGLVIVFFAGTFTADALKTPIGKYLTPDTAARIGIGGVLLEDEAAMERKALIGDSIREAEVAPWTGRGLGFTDEWNYRVGPHDMYLLFFVEGGVPGMALFLCLMALIWASGVGTNRILAWQIVAASLFSHNLLDEPAMVMMIAYAVARGDASRWAIEGRSSFATANLGVLGGGRDNSDSRISEGSA